MKKWIIILTTFASLLVISGAISAQDTSQTPSPRATEGRPSPIHIVLAIVADETGIKQTTILGQYVAGESLAEIILANNGDVQSVIDQSVSQITAQVNNAVVDGKMTQVRADRVLANLPEVITQAINSKHFHNRPNRGASQRILIQSVAEATGLQPIEILRQLQGGSTLATIINENGSDLSRVISAAVSHATREINDAVAAGLLEQEQANRLLARLEDIYTAALNGQFREGAQEVLTSFAVLRLAAEESGLTFREIVQEIYAGQSLRDVLIHNNVDVNAFISMVVETARTRLNQAVDNGRLTQTGADIRLAEFEKRLIERIDQAGDTEILPDATTTG